jgi:hypothetical protein
MASPGNRLKCAPRRQRSRAADFFLGHHRAGAGNGRSGAGAPHATARQCAAQLADGRARRFCGPDFAVYRKHRAGVRRAAYYCPRSKRDAMIAATAIEHGFTEFRYTQLFSCFKSTTYESKFFQALFWLNLYESTT